MEIDIFRTHGLLVMGFLCLDFNMNREDITRMAQEAGFVGMDGDHGALRRFAALVAFAERERLTDAAMKAAEKAVDVAIALEREACAKLCDELDRKSWEETGEPMSGYGDAIRERT